MSKFYTIKSIRILCGFLFLSLFIICIYDFSKIFTIERSPYANKTPSSGEMLKQLDNLVLSKNLTFNDLSLVTDLFYKGIKHSWPDKIEQTKFFNSQHPIVNSIIFKFFMLFMKPDSLRGFYFFEYNSFKTAIRRGIGLCSQHALAVSNFINNKTTARAKTIGLNGHVVTEVHINSNQVFISDSDFNVVLPFSLEYAKKHTDLVWAYYAKKSISQESIENITKIYKNSTYNQYVTFKPSLLKSFIMFSFLLCLLLLLISLSFLINVNLCQKTIDIKRRIAKNIEN